MAKPKADTKVPWGLKHFADKKRRPARPAKPVAAKEDPGALRAFMLSKMAGR